MFFDHMSSEIDGGREHDKLLCQTVRIRTRVMGFVEMSFLGEGDVSRVVISTENQVYSPGYGNAGS